MTNRDGPPPLHFGDCPNGAYWSAEGSPDNVEEESYEVSGTVIHFMPDDSVTVPLWDAEGLLPEEATWLNQATMMCGSQSGATWSHGSAREGISVPGSEAPRW